MNRMNDRRTELANDGPCLAVSTAQRIIVPPVFRGSYLPVTALYGRDSLSVTPHPPPYPYPPPPSALRSFGRLVRSEGGREKSDGREVGGQGSGG